MAIGKAPAISVDRLCGGKVAKRILVDLSHQLCFMVPIAGTLDNTEAIDP
jgi:hypothetical protein